MNTITLINQKIGKVSCEDEDLFNKLKNKLSFRLAGVEFTPAFRNGNWDGMTYLINNKNQFPIGLLDKIKQFFKDNNEDFTLEDLRKPIVYADPINLDEKLKSIKKIPRDYQVEAADCVLKHNNGIIRACTGAGKTLCAALMTAKLNKPTIIYVIGIDLLKQFHETFSSIFDEEIGYIGDGVCNIQRINIASIWTVGKALDIKINDLIVDDEISEEKFEESNKYKILQTLKGTKVHILDECHIATTITIRSIHKVIEPEHFYGLSGTPYREDNSDMLIEGILGNKIIDISASSLINRGYLTQPMIKFVDISRSTSKEPYHSIYKDYIVENEERNNIIIDYTKELTQKGYKTLVLFKQIKHGKILASLLKQNNIKFAMLSGKDSLEQRNKVKKDIYDGTIDVILASTIFDIGVDIECLSGLILAGGGKSYVRALQRIGRILRIYPNKKIAAVVDFYDDVKYLRQHSLDRYKIYQSEVGFKVIPSNAMRSKI